MNVDLVRKIDYWVGIPACWLLTGVSFLETFCQKASPISEKISFRRTLGDGKCHPGLSDHEGH